ncbi:hypothetical protein ABZ793_09755 [Micromonospora sp. NPDC047465]|uniref:hypothetical protein n=1 Tax=unclassified Micromonospora TaxID=2617518 RepID=UPI0033D42878
MQAAAMSVAAVVTAAVVVRASRRRAVRGATAGDLPAMRDSVFGETGNGGAADRVKETTSSAR